MIHLIHGLTANTIRFYRAFNLNFFLQKLDHMRSQVLIFLKVLPLQLKIHWTFWVDRAQGVEKKMHTFCCP